MKVFSVVDVIFFMLVVGALMFGLGMKLGGSISTDELRTIAVQRNSGRWEISKDGVPQFIWLYCQTPEKDKK